MSLLTAHLFGVTGAVALATAAVLCGGLLPPAAWLFLLLPLLWPLWHRALGPVGPRASTLMALVAVFGPLAAWLATGRTQGTTLASLALMAILAVRQASRTLPSHDLQALVLALLLVCVGSLLNPNPSYALLLLPFALCMVSALVTRQLCYDVAMAAFRNGAGPGERALEAAQLGRTDVTTPRFLAVIVGLSLWILATAGVVFAAFPRVGLPAFGQSQLRALPESVTLGETPWNFADGEVAARIWGLGRNTFDHGLYLRGRSYDRITAKGFGESHVQVGIRELAGAGPAISYEVVQNAAEGDPLLTLGPLQRGVVTTSDNNEVKVMHARGGERPCFVVGQAGSHRARLTGRVMATRPQPPPPGVPEGPWRGLEGADAGQFAGHYLALPTALQAPLTPLVRTLLADPNTLSFASRAARLRRHLLQGYTYDTREGREAAGSGGPLLAFLFDHKRGNCTYFASAFAAMLRAAGVPSRVVGGFEGGRWDPDQAVAVFTGVHAHAWVEWYQPGAGWVVDDATPPRGSEVLSGFAVWRERLGRFWQMDVLQFNLANQLGFVHGLQAGFASLRQVAFADGAGPAAKGASWQKVGWVVAAAGAALSAALLALRRRTSGRRLNRFTRALEAALVRALGRPLAPAETFRGAVASLPVAGAVGHPATANAVVDHALLHRAVAIHEAIRFGSQVPPADLAALGRALRRL